MEDEGTTAKKHPECFVNVREAHSGPRAAQAEIKSTGDNGRGVCWCVCLRYREIYQVISQQHYLSYHELSPHEWLKVSHATRPCYRPTLPRTFSLRNQPKIKSHTGKSSEERQGGRMDGWSTPGWLRMCTSNDFCLISVSRPAGGPAAGKLTASSDS